MCVRLGSLQAAFLPLTFDQMTRLWSPLSACALSTRRRRRRLTHSLLLSDNQRWWSAKAVKPRWALKIKQFVRQCPLFEFFLIKQQVAIFCSLLVALMSLLPFNNFTLLVWSIDWHIVLRLAYFVRCIKQRQHVVFLFIFPCYLIN